MLIGFNNDVEYRGMTFHIQTEDHGLNGSTIETQLFYSGAILDTVMTSYADAIVGLSEEEAEERIRAQMKGSHRSLFKKLRAGEYDEMVGLERISKTEESEIDAEAEDFTPSQERVSAEAQKLEEGGEKAIEEFEKKHAGAKKSLSQLSLNKLKSQLSALKQPGDTGALRAEITPEDTQEDDAAMATQIMDAKGVGFEFSSDYKDSGAPKDGGQPQTLRRGIFGEEPAPEPQKSQTPRPTRAPVRTAPVQSAPVQSAPVQKDAAPRTLELPKTGVQAWDGCRPTQEDLSLVDLVEEFLAS